MKAIVLAGGLGTRLHPLTVNIPKPMVPVVNKPVLEHTIENLIAHGIRSVVVNLHSYPAIIKKHFGTGARHKIHITYSTEKSLLGTAGGVKKMEDLFDSTFVVMSGDGLTDIDLTKAIAFHKKNKALATMVIKAIDTKFDYGVTLTDKGGRIKRFIEKPSWSDVFANTVNTGMYILEPEVFRYIPADTFYDFGSQMWPDLLKKKKRIFGYVMDEYWTDVGNLAEYKKGVRDALDRKLKIEIPGTQIKPGIWVGKGTTIGTGVQLHAPCVIGDYCFIGKNAIIGKYSTVGDHTTIGEKAAIYNSILWEKVTVAKNVHLDNCIIGYDAKVSADISVFEGAVLNID